MRILIDKTLNPLFILRLILCEHGNVFLSLTLKENTFFKHFYYNHIVEIPTQNG